MSEAIRDKHDLECVVMRKLGEDENNYLSDYGHVMKREHGKTPNDNEMNGRWVLRNEEGEMLDYDKYRNDLEERNNLILVG